VQRNRGLEAGYLGPSFMQCLRRLEEVRIESLPGEILRGHIHDRLCKRIRLRS
jgi:hypothetical protein